MVDLEVPGLQLAWTSFAIALFAGLTMVTNVPFYSFKDVNFRKSVPFIAVFLIALFFALVSIDPPKVLFPLFIVYGLSGYLVFFWRMAKGKPVSIIQTDEEPVDESERR
jgi:CDP-diacylglycerol--serine O-phosphatidyltransferase